MASSRSLDDKDSVPACVGASSGSHADVHAKYYNPVVMSLIRDDWIQQQLRRRQAAYTEVRSTRILTGTWNVNAKKPFTSAEAYKLVQWLAPEIANGREHDAAPDLVALGFQEIVDLNAVNVVVNSTFSVQRSGAWEDAVLTALNAHLGRRTSTACVQYKRVLKKHLVGILVVVFVRCEHWDQVHDVQGATAGVGIMGVMGNKGAAAVRLQFYSSSLCFVSAHFAAHRDNVLGRNADYVNILSKVHFGESSDDGPVPSVLDMRGWSGPSSILHHDFVFWMGDLNYRVQETLATDEIFRRAESPAWHELTRYDQLTLERQRGHVFDGFDEGALTFPPTYKFQAGTSRYDRRPEKKLRAPAWCDRVLWRAKTPSDVALLAYASVPALDLSDHKPVHALFRVDVQCHVESKKHDVMREIQSQLDKWENDNMPKVRLRQEPSTGASPGVVAFPDLQFGVEQTQHVVMENTGLVVTHFRFIPKLDDVAVCKHWLSVSPLFGMIPPKESMTICIHALVDETVAPGLTRGTETLDETLILRVENGRDYFLVVSGQYATSCFGTSVEQLVASVEPMRYTKLTTVRSPTTASVFSVWAGGAASSNARAFLGPAGPTPASSPEPSLQIPKELWRMVNDLLEHFLHETNLFVEAGRKAELVQLREALDTGAPFPSHAGYSMAELLVRWLQALPESVVPEDALAAAEASSPAKTVWRALLDALPPLRYNLVVYLVAFLREVLKHRATNRLTPDKLAFVFGRCLVAPCRRGLHRGLARTNASRLFLLDDGQPPSTSSTASTVSSSGSNPVVPEDRLRRRARELELAHAEAAKRADTMEKLLLAFLS
ncbi:hypothetical protein PsorP6_011959 [Peronosclerospora sorghi]|uniref:Uncharacterized protein n=1 Tax=Peronosclerospora sorghi TaxID=230839 RepID=A0ACC0WKK8_9STRA|nr:hypothetical protein PsorP6_011959 [Peronosclerospora sorghi]